MFIEDCRIGLDYLAYCRQCTSRVRCGNIRVRSHEISDRLESQIFYSIGDIQFLIPRFNNGHQGAATLKKFQLKFSMDVQWLDSIHCNIYFNSTRLLLLFQYKFRFSMFKAISSSYVSDFYLFWLKVCFAIDAKSKISLSNRPKVIGKHTCFIGLSCKFYRKFSFITFAQKHKFIRMIQILRYL